MGHNTSTYMKADRVIDIERTQATIARVEAKLASADEGSKEFYRLCLVGWRAWLKRLEAEGLGSRPKG
jgi:hypothetical protein